MRNMLISTREVYVFVRVLEGTCLDGFIQRPTGISHWETSKYARHRRRPERGGSRRFAKVVFAPQTWNGCEVAPCTIETVVSGAFIVVERTGGGCEENRKLTLGGS